MKERIRELALDAGLINYVDHETPRTYFINGHADIEEVQEFAELIVRECCDVLQTETIMHDGYGYNQGFLHKKIKEHFGVEK